MNRSFVLTVALSAAASALPAQAARDFTWEGRVASGTTIYVRNLNGDIRVERASGATAEVTGTKRVGRRGDPNDVRIESRKIGEDVIVCAFWHENATCDDRGYRTRSEGWRGRENDTQVNFTVRLPEGVNVVVSSVNGDVRVGGATARVHASTVNGRVEATSSGGPVNASTVNGNIDARMRELGRDDLHFSTVNGSIFVEVPGNLDADVELSTVNGSISADFPITLNGRINPRHLRATIGRGGRRMRFSTVNGSVELRRGS